MRWPPLTLVTVCIALWVDALAGGRFVSGTPAVVVVAAVALAAGVRAAVVPLGVAGAVSVALLAAADQVADAGRFTLASDGVFYCVIVFGPSLLGGLLAARNRQVATLTVRRRALESRRAVAVQVARAAERERIVRRIDRDLADRLVQVVADVREAVALARTDPNGVPPRLDRVESSARDALGELRDVLGTLRTSAPTAERPDVAAATPSVPGPARPDRTWRRVDLVDVALVAASTPLAVETALPGHPGPAALNVVCALAQGGALVLLRRRPLIGVAGLLAFALIQTALLAPLPPTVSWLVLGLCAAFLLGLTRSRRTSVVGFVLLAVGAEVLTLATPAAHRDTAGLVPSLVMGLLVWVGGRLAGAAQARAQELRAITDELAERQADEITLAVLDQRAGIGRDLHDAGAHALTVVCLQAAAAQTWWYRDPEQARGALDTLAAVADTTVSRLGQSIGGYAAGANLDAPSLDALVGIGRALGLEVDLGVSGSPRAVPDDVVHVAYRLVQESLTNAARHAAGSTVRIALRYLSDELEVQVLDTGTSGGAVVLTGAGAGLRGMRERVEALHGELRAGPRGPGFEILARLPT